MRMPRRVLWRVYWRSLFLQAAWNPQGMQNLGLAYALYPALEVLYPDEAGRSEALRRHLTVFNTHPYVAASILGGVLHHERRIARGEEPPDRVVAFKAALMGPLAALGDGFFWLSLRPAVGAACAALVPWLGAWAALLFVVLYNTVHLVLRARFYRMGLLLGDGVLTALGAERLPVWGTRLRHVAAACAGGLAAGLAAQFGAQQPGAGGPLLGVGCLVLGGVGYWAVGRRLPHNVLLFLAAGLAVAAGAFL